MPSVGGNLARELSELRGEIRGRHGELPPALQSKHPRTTDSDGSRRFR